MYHVTLTLRRVLSLQIVNIVFSNLPNVKLPWPLWHEQSNVLFADTRDVAWYVVQWQVLTAVIITARPLKALKSCLNLHLPGLPWDLTTIDKTYFKQNVFPDKEDPYLSDDVHG